MKIKTIPTAMMLSTAILFPLGLQAQESVTPATSTIITVGNIHVINIRTGAGGYTPQQRADAVRVRLIPILSLENLVPSDVKVTSWRPKQDASISVRGLLLITVDATLAKANYATPLQLANKWAATLRTALPEASVKPNSQGI